MSRLQRKFICWLSLYVVLACLMSSCMLAGGYTLRNVARCWCFETSRMLGLDLEDQLPDAVSSCIYFALSLLCMLFPHFCLNFYSASVTLVSLSRHAVGNSITYTRSEPAVFRSLRTLTIFMV